MTDDGQRPDEALDMSRYEEMLEDVPSLGPPDARRKDSSVEPPRRRPGVEWAIAWGDGTLTPVSREDAARYVASLDPAFSVVCRIVGGWDPA